MGVEVQNTTGVQALQETRVYPGVAADFTLYDDDGVSYDYETGKASTTRQHWDEKAQRLTAQRARRARALGDLVSIVHSTPASEWGGGISQQERCLQLSLIHI